MLPGGTIWIGGFPVAVDRLWLIGLVVVLGAALAIWFQRSRTGLAIQAAAENERAASFARLSPQTLGMVTWVLATVFVSFIMILAGPAIGVLTAGQPHAARRARAGRGAHRPPELAVDRPRSASFALGVLQSELVFLSSTKDVVADVGQAGPHRRGAVPRHRDHPVRARPLDPDARRGHPHRPAGGDPAEEPSAGDRRARPRRLPGPGLTSGGYRFGVITSLAGALIALSLVVLTGMVGQISLAQTAFAGVAGLALSKIGTGVPFPLSLLLAAVIAGIAGVIVGLPALRIRGAQLAVVTLAAA